MNGVPAEAPHRHGEARWGSNGSDSPAKPQARSTGKYHYSVFWFENHAPKTGSFSAARSPGTTLPIFIHNSRVFNIFFLYLCFAIPFEYLFERKNVKLLLVLYGKLKSTQTTWYRTAYAIEFFLNSISVYILGDKGVEGIAFFRAKEKSIRCVVYRGEHKSVAYTARATTAHRGVHVLVVQGMHVSEGPGMGRKRANLRNNSGKELETRGEIALTALFFSPCTTVYDSINSSLVEFFLADRAIVF
jgi:hypothetical protein